MSWSSTSKAADKSNITRTAQLLLSSATAMSWWTRRRAVSVEWCFFQNFRYERQVRDRSIIFEISLSKPDFLSKGLTTASLKLYGTEHSDIDLLMMSVIWGTNTELSHSLSRLVGNGSKQHVFDAEFDKIFKTSSQDVGSKFAKNWPSNGLSNAMTSVFPSLLSLTSLVRMSLILLLKYDPKPFANSKLDVQSGRIGTLVPQVVNLQF